MSYTLTVSAHIVLSSNAILKVASSSNIITDGIKNTSGVIKNAGVISIRGDIINNGGGLFDSSSTGTVTFEGTNAQEITGSATTHYYGTVVINNTNGVSITNSTGGASQEVHGVMSFEDGKFNLTDFDLTLSGSGDPIGISESTYIVTNGSGQLKRSVEASNTLFPVGNSVYNPIILNNSGTSDIYGVNVVDSKPSSFPGTEHIVNISYEVTELIYGNSNLTAKIQWDASQEAGGFDRVFCCLGLTIDNGSTVFWGSTGTASGSSPFSKSQNDIPIVGTFIIGDYYYAYGDGNGTGGGGINDGPVGDIKLHLTSNTKVNIAAGSNLIVNKLENTSSSITNKGNVSIVGDVTNNSGGLFDSGSTGVVTFKGIDSQEISGASTIDFYGTLNINNANNVSITNTIVGAAQHIHGVLSFTSGKFNLGNFDLILEGPADPTGVGTTSYIVTTGTGQLKRTVDAVDILFAVGNTSYNPLTLNNTGTADLYGVMAIDTVPVNFTGTEHIINRSWEVSEAVTGGSNLFVKSQWNSAEELIGFDRTISCIGITSDGGTTVSWGATNVATGSDPYLRNTTGISTVGTFMVGDNYYEGLVIDLKIILAGAWNTTNSNMDKTLNTLGLIPLTDPYGLSTTVAAVPVDAVDWIKIELRNSTTPATITNTFARFIDINGQIIEEDGSNLKLTGIATGNYHIAVRHNNHFGVMTNTAVTLSNLLVIDFTNTQASVWQDGSISTNAAMKEIEPGIFGLWDGNANADGILRYNGTDNDRGAILGALSNAGATLSGYAPTDLNMDGITRYNGTDNDRGVIIGNLPNAGESYYQHLPE